MPMIASTLLSASGARSFPLPPAHERGKAGMVFGDTLAGDGFETRVSG